MPMQGFRKGIGKDPITSPSCVKYETPLLSRKDFLRLSDSFCDEGADRNRERAAPLRP